MLLYVGRKITAYLLSQLCWRSLHEHNQCSVCDSTEHIPGPTVFNEEVSTHVSIEREFKYLPKQVHRYRLQTVNLNVLTPWLMLPRGSMPHSQGLSNNPYPDLNQPNSSY